MHWEGLRHASTALTPQQILRRRPAEGEDTLLVYVDDTESTATTFTDANATAGIIGSLSPNPPMEGVRTAEGGG